MTWTLRLYDADGTEIGWATTDPYDYQITHPDGADTWNKVRYVFNQSEFPVDGAEYEDWGAGQTFMGQTRDTEGLSGSGQEHAEWLQDEVSGLDGVASTAIADE